MKVCLRCGVEKELSEFSSRPTVRNGPQPRSWCKRCASEYSIQVQKDMKANDPELWAEKQRIKVKKRNLSKVGLSEEEYLAMGEKQNWLCAVCNTDIRNSNYIDHDHVSGRVRKLLCFHCNVGLGHFRDSKDLFESAIRYIQDHDV